MLGSLWILVGILQAVLLGIRWLRWLAWTQQKEYRTDRIWAFWLTSEGLKEWGRLLPTLHDFSRTGLKRPRFTLRLGAVAGLSALLILLGQLLVWVSPGPWSWLVWVIMYFSLPALVFVAVLPSALIAAVLTWWYLWQAQKSIKHGKPLIIGVGGCYGKTSTKLILHHLLDTWKPTFVTPKSFNTKLSAAQSIMRDYRGQSIAIIEYGTYKKGEITQLAKWFPPQLAMETGFTEQHLKLFGSIENIIAAEGEMGAVLPKGAPLFTHAADQGALKIAQHGAAQSGAKIIAYTGPNSVVELSQIELDPNGRLQLTWQQQRIKTQLVGKHYAVNVAGAIAVAEHVGVSQTQIIEALKSFQPNDRFISTVANQYQSLVIDDGYASNPMGMSSALELVAELKKKRPTTATILVFGGIVDLGELSTTIHTQLAKEAQAICDQVIYLGDVGWLEFAAVFGERCQKASSPDQIQALLGTNQVILIEGRIPTWLTRQIKT